MGNSCGLSSSSSDKNQQKRKQSSEKMPPKKEKTPEINNNNNNNSNDEEASNVKNEENTVPQDSNNNTTNAAAAAVYVASAASVSSTFPSATGVRTTDSSSFSNKKVSNLRVVTANILFESFYKKYTKTKNVYPKDERDAAFKRALKDEPMRSADVVCFQEFDMSFMIPLKEAGFRTFFSVNSSGRSNSAFVATAFRYSTMRLMVDSITIPLEEGGSKALLLSLAYHGPSGQPILIGNAHVPWSRNSADSHKYFNLMRSIMLQAPEGTASVFCGDFNTDTSSFSNAMKADKTNNNNDTSGSEIHNAIPDVPFTSLSPDNKALTIDHMWYFGGNENLQYERQQEQDEGDSTKNNILNYMTRATLIGSSGNDDDNDENQSKKIVPTSYAPSDIDDFVRHSSSGDKPDYKIYFSDHATVAADFTVSVKKTGGPMMMENAPWFNLASKAEKEFLGRSLTKQN